MDIEPFFRPCEIGRLKSTPMNPSDRSAHLCARNENKAMISALSKLGFSDLKRQEAGFFARLRGCPLSQGAPVFSARHKGRPALVYISDVVDSLFAIPPMSDAQYADAQGRSEDIFYAALYVDEEASTLMLVGTALMRHQGKWRTNSARSREYLPFSQRTGHDRLGTILGAGALFKLGMLLPRMLEGGALQLFIENLCDRDHPVEEPNLAFGLLPSPMFAIVSPTPARGEKLRVQRTIFYFDGDAVCSCHLLQKPNSTGIVSLRDDAGNVISADCLESLALQPLFNAGQGFVGTLSLAGDSISVQDRRERELIPGDEPSYLTVMGEIEMMRVLSTPFGPLTNLRVLYKPGRSCARLNVFLAPHVLKGLRLQEGDAIRVTGYITFAPEKLMGKDPYVKALENLHFMPVSVRRGERVPSEEVWAAEAFPAELYSELVKTSHNLARSFEEDGAVGGHGFTRETAWRILLDDPSAISLEYDIVRIFFGCSPDLQSLRKDEEGNVYDCLSFLAESGGKVYRVEQWFDISAYYKKTYGCLS